MQPARYIRNSKGKDTRSAGFSLIEMLVTLFITGVMMTLFSAFFTMNIATKHDMGDRVEVQQGLRGLMEIMSEELRQAGICLPPLGTFITLTGTNGGTRDTLTIRTGMTDVTTLLCIKAGTTAAAAAGAATLTVGPGEGNLFTGVSLVYVTTNAVTGDFYPLVSYTANTVTLGAGTARAHPIGTGIYAIEARTYAVEVMADGRNALTVSVNGAASQPLVSGVQQFNLEYLVCSPSCSFTNLPTTADQWRQVREVRLTGTVQARYADRNGTYASETGATTIKPRNLM